ncbi:MAG: helix-turn-helix transcriptional regulator, partial [Planctomycetes bacterium]|nr:helix-turn-helix transcriptional regulator [Planctomycetota bacterium]
MKNLSPGIHSRLKQLHLKKQTTDSRRISHAEAARDIGITVATFNRWYHNQVKYADLETIAKIRAYYGLPGETKLRLDELIEARAGKFSRPLTKA